MQLLLATTKTTAREREHKHLFALCQRHACRLFVQAPDPCAKSPALLQPAIGGVARLYRSDKYVSGAWVT